MTLIRFPYERKCRGWFIETRWFCLRVYPPVLPNWTVWRKQ